MDEIRQTIRFNKYATDVLKNKAAPMWPELDDNLTALVHKVIADWDHIRNERGGRTERLEKRLDEHDRLLKMICAKLDIDTGDSHAPDTDHA